MQLGKKRRCACSRALGLLAVPQPLTTTCLMRSWHDHAPCPLLHSPQKQLDAALARVEHVRQQLTTENITATGRLQERNNELRAELEELEVGPFTLGLHT